MTDKNKQVWALAEQKAKAIGYISIWSMNKQLRQKFLDAAAMELGEQKCL